MPTSSDDVALRIFGKQWHAWDELEVHLALDEHASVGFRAPFEVERKEFRETFRPFSFAPLDIAVGGSPVFTGTLIDVTPDLSATERSVEVSAYSKAAVLDECDPPASILPVEANGLTLKQIAQRLAEPFGVGVMVDGPEGAPFKRVKTRQKKVNTKAEADEKIGDFLAELARQRGFVVSSNANGDWLARRAVKPGRPVVRLEESVQPLVKVTATFDPRSYYNEITGFTTAKRGNLGSKYTERNQRLSGGVLRSHSFKMDDVEKADAPAAVKAKIGRMFANMVTYVVHLPTWRDPKGALWQPNTTVTLKAPNCMVYWEVELLVRDVYLKQSGKEKTASLGLVLPGAFNGEVPPKMPWEDP